MDERIVYVVDDDPALRKSLKRLIEQISLPVQTFSTANEFLDAYEPSRPGCLVLDVRMPGMSGMDLQRELATRGSELPVIIITGYGDVPMAVEALKRGATDFIEKPYRPQALLESIQRALVRAVEMQRARSEHEQVSERFRRLTEREREVVMMVVSGKTNRQIASLLGVTAQAIDARRARAMAKLNVGSIAELTELVLRQEWGQHGSTPPGHERESA